jgi:hypothetical protein
VGPYCSLPMIVSGPEGRALAFVDAVSYSFAQKALVPRVAYCEQSGVS